MIIMLFVRKRLKRSNVRGYYCYNIQYIITHYIHIPFIIHIVRGKTNITILSLDARVINSPYVMYYYCMLIINNGGESNWLLSLLFLSLSFCCVFIRTACFSWNGRRERWVFTVLRFTIEINPRGPEADEHWAVYTRYDVRKTVNLHYNNIYTISTRTL